MCRFALAAAVSGALAILATGAHGFDGLRFTPVHLVDQAKCILLLRIKPADKEGLCRAEVVRVLKSTKALSGPDKVQIIDLTRSTNAEHAGAVREMIAANGDGPALLFVEEGEEGESIGKLHLGGKWVSLDAGEAADSWQVDVIDSHMEGTWAGGTDMLLRLTELILKHPDIDFPITCVGSWDDAVEAGRVAGKARAAMAVDLSGNGRQVLFVASDTGDRIFACDPGGGGFSELTAELKLGSRSVAAAWGDFDGNGRLDLVSFDGTGLTIWSQDDAGAFSPAPVPDAPRGGCFGLGSLDLGVKGRAGLVWSTGAGPVLLVPDGKKTGVFASAPLTIAAGAHKDRSGAGAALVADFDDDGLPDIIQPFAKGSVFFKGKGGGEFSEGAACAVALGEGRTSAFFGDFDADGRLDIFTTAGDSPRLWQNAGSGRFANVYHLCGELTYISKPGCIGGNACDINNDGRQDVFLFYSDMAPQVFFNRGFRSFGHAHKPIDLAESGNLPEAAEGSRPRCWPTSTATVFRTWPWCSSTARWRSCSRPRWMRRP